MDSRASVSDRLMAKDHSVTVAQVSHSSIMDDDGQDTPRHVPATMNNQDGLDESHQKQSSGISVLDILSKIGSILLPVIFIAVGVLQVKKANLLIDDPYCYVVDEVNKVAITMWPIMFAAVVSHSLKVYGIFKAQRGIKMMNLDRIVNTTSFATAIKQPFKHRTFDWTFILLFLVWLLSPIASQALQRMTYREENGWQTYSQVYYSLPTYLSNADSDINRKALFGGAIMSSHDVMLSTQDSWTYPKIPLITSLGVSAQDEETSPVYTFQGQGNPQWSSLLGIPFESLPLPASFAENYTTFFSVPVGYFAMNCTVFKNASSDQVKANSYYPSLESSRPIGLLSYIDSTASNSTDPKAANRGTFHLAFGDSQNSETGLWDTFIVSDCDFELVSLIAGIFCESQSLGKTYQTTLLCYTYTVQKQNNEQTAQRYSLQPGVFDKSLATAFPDFNGSNILSATYLINPTTILRYENDTDVQKGLNPINALLQLSAMNISTNFGTLVNTFYQAGGDTASYLSGTVTPTSNSFPANSTLTDVDLSWTTSYAWAGVLFGSAIIILVLAIASIIWEARLINRDFLDFTNTLIGQNEYFKEKLQGIGNHKDKKNIVSGFVVQLREAGSSTGTRNAELVPCDEEHHSRLV